MATASQRLVRRGPSEAVRAGDARQRLDRGVGNADEPARGGGEHHAVVLNGSPWGAQWIREPPCRTALPSIQIVAGIGEKWEMIAPCIAGER